MDWTVLTYAAYTAVTIPLTIWVARTLATNGRIFLGDVFAGNEQLADAVNRLLVAGFYLLNLGFVSLYLRIDDPVLDLKGLIEQLSVKIGVVTIILGLVHFTNVFIFNSIARRHRFEAQRASAMQSGFPGGQSARQHAPLPAYPAPGQV